MQGDRWPCARAAAPRMRRLLHRADAPAHPARRLEGHAKQLQVLPQHDHRLNANSYGITWRDNTEEGTTTVRVKLQPLKASEASMSYKINTSSQVLFEFLEWT